MNQTKTAQEMSSTDIKSIPFRQGQQLKIDLRSGRSAVATYIGSIQNGLLVQVGNKKATANYEDIASIQVYWT